MTCLEKSPTKGYQEIVVCGESCAHATDYFTEPLTALKEKLREAEWNYRGVLNMMSDQIALIDQIGREDEFDECGPFRPTKHALDFAKSLVEDAARNAPLDFVFPLGNVTSDYDGGILIEWKKRDRSVHLAVRSGPKKGYYLYHEAGRRYGVEHNVDGATLVSWLEDLNDAG